MRKGDFPGSFKIGDGDFSLGFDGFIKAAAFYDNNFEAGTINPLPQLYGLLGQDTRGGFHLDASLSRFIVDGRAPVPGGKVRGYIEFDFASSTNFKLRHAYLTYATPKGQLLAGQTWSNFMDLRSIPEAVSEPVTSGLNFVRQPQFAWSQRFGKGFNYAVAIEDPDSPDIRVTDQGVFRRTNRPDFIGNFGWGRESGHIQIAGLLRKHEIFSKDGISDTATGWGVHLGSSVKITSKDKLAFDATYGEGIARYLVGLDPSAGGYLDSLNRVRLRDNYGGFASYQRLWTDTFRTNVYGGFAHSAPGFDQATGTFKRTIFFSGNFLYRLNTYLTFGVEYMYGKKTFLGGSSLDNHRVLVGFQLF